MDPVSQGVLGGVAGQQVSSKQQKVAALVVGCLGGMAADLDVLISSDKDPLLFLEYHRHFTHALVFIPIGALLCALFSHWVFRRWFNKLDIGFRQVYLFSFAGYATHALLDACTTYGTQLLWPFSDARIAWNNVSVVDPLFTVPLLVLLILSVFKRSQRWATVSAIYVFAYLGLGFLQHHRAVDIAQQIASERGHTPTQLSAKPSFANLLVWKSVYEYNDRYYIDAVRVGFGDNHIVYSGVMVDKLNIATHFPALDLNSQQARDIERFRWFSNQYLALDPDNKNRIIDVRYSLIPNQVGGMWGIVLDDNADPDQHVQWTTVRPGAKKSKKLFLHLWKMILGHNIEPL